MSNPVAVESVSGAQLLPRSTDTPKKVSGWTAFCACDADWRAKHAVYREVAAGITIWKGRSDES